MLINIVKFVVFVRIVDKGSFVKAGESLGLSTAAISKHMKELEKFLNVQLLRRTTRSFTLTESGQCSYVYFSNLLKNLDHFCEGLCLLNKDNPYQKITKNPILGARKNDY